MDSFTKRAAPHTASRDYGVLVRPACAALIAFMLLHWADARTNPVPRERDSNRALVQTLEREGLRAEPADVHWIDEAHDLWTSLSKARRAVVRAHHADEPSDIYLIEAKLAPEGGVLELGSVHNLSDTSAVDEEKLSNDGPRIAWLINAEGSISSVNYADLRGEPRPQGPGWSWLARLQNALTNLQQTGQLRGIAWRVFKFDPPATHVALGFDAEHLLVEADSHAFRIPTETRAKLAAQPFIEETEHVKARPGNLVTWAVDRVRALPWFGNDRMQAVKAIAFAGLDWVERTQGAVTGDDGSARVAEELAGIVDSPATTYTDPESGFPPPPLVPVLSPPLEGEGKWVLLDHDPFIRKNPGAPAPFAISFLRTDRKRAYTQTYITLWDPRQVSLHAMSGTVEPKSATGETGPGLVPRTPAVMGRLLAGFNGGFQAQHGEYGMMSEGIVYLPPKPYAATVAELRDGSSGFGTWPNDDRVPDEIVSFRQNMTPLVADGVTNPYQREWWGGVPPGWTDESRTVRSGLCLTKEGFVAYFYGSSIDADRLALAMQRARCTYGIHLDMNAGHTGLELYHAAEKGHLPEIGHVPDTRWEARGSVPGMPGWEFQGRRMIRLMGLMNFPRYINRESRDFFYLTLRDVLPGKAMASAIAPPLPGEGTWVVKGLPQHGWPYALATSFVRPDRARPETKVNLLKLDGSVLGLAGIKSERSSVASSEQTIVSLRSIPAKTPGSRSIWLGSTGFTLGENGEDAAAVRVASGFAVKDHKDAVAAACLFGPERLFVYAEVASGAKPSEDALLLDALMSRIGCSDPVLFEHGLGVLVGGERDLSGRAPNAPGPALKLVRSQGPGGRRIFTDTPIVPFKVWYGLQSKRVRYFRRPQPKQVNSAPSASALPDPSAARPTLPDPIPGHAPTIRTKASHQER